MLARTHTPGPWHVDQTCGGLAIESVRHGNIGLVNLARASKADARLMSCAPDLLALAKRYASECGECAGVGVLPFGHPDRPDEDLPCDECADIRALIERAEA